MNRWHEWLHHTFVRLDAQPVTPKAALMAFAALVWLRYALEALLESGHALALHLDARLGAADFLHVLASWAVLYLLVSMGLAWASGRELARTNRVVLFCLPLIWLPPLLDFAFSQSGHIAYQHRFDELASSLLGLFNPAAPVGYVTTGVRIEVALAVSLAALYAGVMSAGRMAWLSGLLAGALIYGAVFLLGFLPAIWFAMLGADHAYWLGRSVLRVDGATAPLYWYLPLVLVLAPLWLRASHPPLWSAFLASLRPSRLSIYLAICNMAFLSSSHIGLVGWDWLNAYDLLEVLALNMALMLAFVAMTILNDRHDRDIDAISNSNRPLVSGLVSDDDFAVLGRVCGGLALALALAVDEVAIYPMAGIMALGYLYSAPPFRLRRFVGISHLLLAAIAGFVYLYGATPVLGNLAFQQIDRAQLGTLMLLFFVGAHFKDIKDAEGDRQAGVSTLATWLGPQKAYWLIGTATMSGGVIALSMGWLRATAPTWIALGIFVAGWLWLRNAERVFWVMLLALAVMFAGY